MQAEELWSTGRVKRWHAFPIIGEQNVADHSWGVALIVMEVAEDHLSVNLMRAAITHDSAEFYTGDMPYQTKKRWPQLAVALEICEQDVERVHNIDWVLTGEQREILKWADMFELLLFADYQADLGNRNVVEMQRQCYSIVSNPPTISAYKLLQRYNERNERK